MVFHDADTSRLLINRICPFAGHARRKEKMELQPELLKENAAGENREQRC